MCHYLLKVLLLISFAFFHVNSQCLYNSNFTETSPFPNRTYMSYDSSMKVLLDNYFSGINLTFSYSIAGSSGVPQTRPIPKTLQYTQGNLTDSLPQVAQNPVIAIYWDDSNVTSVTQFWTNTSLLLLLTGTESNYTVIAGSLDRIQASNRSHVPLYSSISIQLPPNASQNSTLQCSRIAPVGQLEYYIDCALTETGNNGASTTSNYFYHLAFPAYPPLQQNISAVPIPLDTLTGSSNPPISSRIIESSANGTETYLIRYYNGLQFVNPIAASSVIEVFNVTNTSSPNLLFTYNSSSSGFYQNFNISSVQISPDFMYVTSAQGDLLIYQDWHQNPPILFQQYSYNEMTFLASSLRIKTSRNVTVESFIAFGSLNSVNLTALLFVSQTYQDFFIIPVAPSKQATLYIQAYAAILGDDFFGLSYSVPNPSSGSPCYYFAIGDITSSLSSDCHTLWSFNQDNYITYARMNPAADTDVFFMLGKDNQYSNYSIFRPTLWMMNMNEDSQGNITVGSSGNEQNISFEVVVLQPNDQSIYLDLDLSDDLQNVAYQMNSNYIMFLNQSIYGPKLNYALESEDILSYSTHITQSIDHNFTLDPGSSSFYCRRKNVNSNQPLLLIETSDSGIVMKLGNINQSSPFNITSLSSLAEKADGFQIFGYYYINQLDLLLYTQNSTQYMVTLDLEDLLQLDETIEGFLSGTEYENNINLQQLPHTPIFTSVTFIELPNGDIQLFGVDDNALYVRVFPSSGLDQYVASSSTSGYPFSSENPFLPAKVTAHSAFPNVAFVTTLNGNITYVVNFIGLVFAAYDNSDTPPTNSAFKVNIIFSRHQADSYQDVIIQPFASHLFYIFPLLNAIEQWDLSVITSPFFTKNLELHTYNISILANPFVQRGNAFSSTTDTLYLLAIDNNTTNLYVLVLKPNIANSFIVDAIQLPFDINNPQNISLDVTETQNSAYGNLLGDLLVVLIGSEYFFWEVYPNPYITFPVRTSDFNKGKINVQYPTILTVQNEWDTVQTPMFVSVYQNEKQLTPSVLQVNVTSTNITSLAFGITELCSGTVYDLGVMNNEGVNITSYISFNDVTSFPNTTSGNQNVSGVLEMKNYTYYAASEQLILVNNSDQKITYLPMDIMGNCSLYVDDTESYGIATCMSGPSQGFLPFTLKDLFRLPCPFTNIPSLQDAFIDGYNGLLFLLMQATNGDNSNITIYNISNDICLTQEPVYTIEGWSLPDPNPNFAGFDILMMECSNLIHIIFVFDYNSGLEIINYNSLTELKVSVTSYPFTEMYKYFEPMQSPPEFMSIQLLDNRCPSTEVPCIANLLIVTCNFHTILLQFNVSSSGFDIVGPNYSLFLVPSDYWIDDYEVENDLLILIGRNMTQSNPSEDIFAYNISGGPKLTNGLNPDDSTVYRAPMWKTTLISDPSEYPVLNHPTISLNNYGDLYVLNFPNLQNQSTVSYNITDNMILSWSGEALEAGQVSLTFSNNFQEVVIPVMLVQEEAAASAEMPLTWEVYLVFGLGGLVLLILIIFSLWYCKRSYRKGKIQYSRKVQKDPLREFML